MFALFSITKLLLILLAVACLGCGLYLLLTEPSLQILTPGFEVPAFLKFAAGQMPAGVIFIAVGALGLWFASKWRLEERLSRPDGTVVESVRGADARAKDLSD